MTQRRIETKLSRAASCACIARGFQWTGHFIPEEPQNQHLVAEDGTPVARVNGTHSIAVTEGESQTPPRAKKMNKNCLLKLFWIFWFSTTVLTGILAGFMVSHSVMLGRFFNWYIESNNTDLLRQTFTVFRETASPGVLYNSPLYLAFLSGVIWTILAFIIKRDRTIAILAGLSTFWVGNIFFLSFLNKAEEAVLSSRADTNMLQYYLSINLPIHSAFAVIYLASLCLLLWVPLKTHWKAIGAMER